MFHILHRITDALVLRRLAGLIVDKNLLIRTICAEYIVVIDHGFGSSEEKIPVIIQSHMKDRKQVALQHRLEIDQHIPAADQVQPSKRRVLKNIMLREYDHLPDVVVNDIFISLAAEIL